jgi:hypothetical protein
MWVLFSEIPSSVPGVSLQYLYDGRVESNASMFVSLPADKVSK